MTVQTEPSVDGRRARRERGRQEVIEVVVDLLCEGHVPPRPEEVMSRSGVSEATLFRYFDTLADLQHEAMQRFIERSSPLIAIPELGRGDLVSRTRRFTNARVELFLAVAPVARLARARSFDQPHFATTLQQVRVGLADQVRVQFAPELASRAPSKGDDLVAVLTTMTSFESWDHQHLDLRRSPSQIRRSWKQAILTLCA
jgi:AcrR family transcriptional regulator